MLFFVLYLLVGAVAGTLSGLIGVGGGVVIVPALAYLFQVYDHIPNVYAMHMAIGTSLAIMIVNTGRSYLAHTKYQIDFKPYYFLLLPGVLIGTILGAVLAHYMHSRTLSILFSICIVVVAIKMLFFNHYDNRHHKGQPKTVVTRLFGFFVGVTSALLGLGGGTFTVPYLTHYDVSMRQAVMAAVSIGFTIAVVGACSFVITGWFVPGLPKWSTGYIYWPAWLGVSLTGVVFAPLGVKWSHRIKGKVLQRYFAVFLLVVSIHMLFF